MSYRALNWAWEADLPTSQKFVLVALADMADEHESCFPGQERLARMVGGSVSTVHRAVKSLEATGYITRQQRRGADGMRTSDRYRLNVNRSICEVESPVNDDGVTGQMVPPHRSQRPGNPQRTTREPSVLLSDARDDFGMMLDAIWKVWPSQRRSTRKVVEQKFRAALKVSSWEIIAAAAETHAAVWGSWPASDIQFVPLLSTWLHQERWTGAVPQPRAAARLTTVDTGRAADAILSAVETPHLRALS